MALKSITVQLVAGAALIFAGSIDASAAKCVLAGGQGTGITPDLAKTMSTIALDTSIKNMGAKASGKIDTKCETTLVISTCTSRRRACK